MALKGIKVLELAGLAPGPYCGMNHRLLLKKHVFLTL